MKKIALYQPKHIYAPQTGNGHIYMPTSLLSVGARIIKAGGDVEIADGNLQETPQDPAVIGVNLLGAAYIQTALELRKQIDSAVPMLLGGQVINGLSGEQIKRMFGDNTFNGNNDQTLSDILQLQTSSRLRVMNSSNKLPTPEETSLIVAYEKISDANMREYLSREFSFYLSQGCKFNCEFCAADRSMVNPVTHEKKATEERYRSMEVIEKDLRYLVKRAQSLGINSLDMYLSNLDLFQTPEKLLNFANIVIAIKKENPGFEFKMRGLATVTSFLIDSHEKMPKVINAIREAGLERIGFGVDGMTPKVWKSIKKGHNTKDKCVESVRVAREVYGITPEVLMVFGHEKDTKHSLELALEFAIDMRDRYGAIPRPHVTKDLVPGNEIWLKPENQDRVDQFLEHPEYFQALDFTALPSPLTHPNARKRRLVEKYFRMMTSILENTTQPIYPISPSATKKENALGQRLNVGKYDL